MNRKQLLDALHKQGMAATVVDLAGAKAWIEANGFDLVDKSNKSVDIDAVWARKASMTVEDEPKAEVKTAPVVEDKAATATAEQSLKAARKVEAALVQDEGRKAPAIGNSKHALARKNYELAIKAGKSVYKDVDEAERAGAYFRSLFAAIKGWNYAERENDLAILGKASTELNNTSAGFLVESQYSADVLWLTETYGMARQTANVQKFSGTDNWRRPRKTGILGMNHLAEGGSITAADNTYDLISLTPRKVGALMLVSNELLDDAAVSVADEFTKAVAEAQAYREDQDYFLGDGTATYGGHVGLATGLPSGAYLASTSNTWAATTLADVMQLPASVENVNPARCEWRCSRQYFFSVLKRLALAAGGTTAEEMLSKKGLRDGADFMFLGDPGRFVQIMPRATAVSTSHLYYGDFVGGSMLGIHTELRIKTSSEYAFNTDQEAFRAISRIAVNIHGDGRATTVGPIAALKTGS